MELNYSKFKEFIEIYAKPRWENQEEKWPLRPGGGELYIQEKILKKAAPFFTKDSLKNDTKGSLLHAIKVHYNLLSKFEFSHVKIFIEQISENDLQEKILDLFYGQDSFEKRLKMFLDWAKLTVIESGKKKKGINATVCSYFLALSNPQTYPYCKPTAYKGAIDCLELKGYEKNDPIERFLHCQYLYKNVLTFLEKEYSLKNGNLFDVHSLFYLYQAKTKPEEGGTQYWIYAPGENAKYWDEYYENGIMGIGWDKMGDLRNYKSKEEIFDKIQELYNYDAPPKGKALINYFFANEINPGDIVFVKKGRKELIGYGIVDSDYIFDSSREHHKQLRKVNWRKKGSWKLSEAQSELSGYSLPIKTLSNITRFRSLVTDICEFLGIKEIKSYLPTKNEFEAAYSLVANLDQVISLDIVLDKIEENAKKKGYVMEENWREITERNIIENWQEK